MFFLVGCATQYIVPANRFMTPESQGGTFQSQFEFQQTPGNQLTANVSNGTVKDGVTTNLIPRSGFLISTSFLDSLDLFWSHTTAANSLLGVKYQFLGTSRSSKGVGHKMAISAAAGGNEHKIEGSTRVDFELKGQEYQLLYGYRFSEMILTYLNYSYGRYNFHGDIISSDPVLNGLKPAYETQTQTVYSGLELTLGRVYGKAEYGYQQLKTTDTKSISQFIFGYSVGFFW